MIEVIEADLRDALHAEAVLRLLDEYARHPMGGGMGLPNETRNVLIEKMQAHPCVFALLAYEGEQAVGVAICVEGFSSFAAKPIMNVHDLNVAKTMQNKGIGRRLLEAVEAKAREHGCCALSLEVRGNNTGAQHLYRSFGFHVGGERIEPAEAYMYWRKPLDEVGDDSR